MVTKKRAVAAVTAGEAVERPAPAKRAAPARTAAKAADGKATAKAATGKAAAKRTTAATAAKAAKKTTAGPAAKGSAAGAGKTGTTAAPARKSSARKTTAKKATAQDTARAEEAAQAADETGAGAVVAKKSTGTSKARKTATAATSGLPKVRPVAAAAAAPGELAVRPGEDPWTPEEVAQARTELSGEVVRLRAELEASELAITGLMRDGGGGAGDDEADTGSKNITREHEIALAANAREMLEQTERALERLGAGTYGLCETCGRPIGKARMQAFPRATLCVECKQQQERRH
ncbi:TraR/DksA family transcriptional regulator [Streptomyces sp. NPDC012888]|uniref:TraR/DksA family transcriptional regulator n=1 Tax=Streptomyces sp. NPDC012888 TaxID=3364855 RepID=UPI00369CC247